MYHTLLLNAKKENEVIKFLMLGNQERDLIKMLVTFRVTNANEAADPRGSAVVSTEEKSHLSVRDPFLTIFWV